ncbi:BadF/BadG/BcrA/BcrD ATPase family protein [Tuberibacillus sp. Marseille-P3662]|uniref:BadF/BadG/BcrA/BcrD ATPase family protein n=1 Tax=Tuberibacillus sp. Marseille-P3662 TaxID=1965358 RepID=UPI000A1CC243|nr:BadF/BadG/BcrA/BcrD ATPase family protein [Tuberibacillus sp. Marseille-P3662]
MSEEDLISFIYGSTHEKKVIAGFAEHVIEASEQDDETAIAILEASGRELALHVESLFRQSGDFHEATPVATAGSIFEHSRILKDCFMNNLKAKKLGRYQQAYSDPTTGAVLAAHDLITKPTKKAGWSY